MSDEIYNPTQPDFSSAQIIGRLTNASNTTLLIEAAEQRFVYKPRSGERQLWDFEPGTLCLRERAAYLVSAHLGWHLVPETLLVEGPLGFGSAQKWVDAKVADVDIFKPAELPSDWLTVTTGVTEDGDLVTLAHADNDDLKKIALFDALVNNADRKAGHLLLDQAGVLQGIDHGVTFNSEPKLRTVLWGWLGQEIPSQWLTDVEKFISHLDETELDELLTKDELNEIFVRGEGLIETGMFPEPSGNWPPVPWPIF